MNYKNVCYLACQLYNRIVTQQFRYFNFEKDVHANKDYNYMVFSKIKNTNCEIRFADLTFTVKKNKIVCGLNNSFTHPLCNTYLLITLTPTC